MHVCVGLEKKHDKEGGSEEHANDVGDDRPNKYVHIDGSLLLLILGKSSPNR